MAQWDVQLFAYLRERHGAVVTVEAEPNVESIFDALEASGIQSASCRLAINNEFVGRQHVLTQGDSLALIPPVSGG